MEKAEPPRRVVAITGEYSAHLLSQEFYRSIAQRQADAHEMYVGLVRDLLLIETSLKQGGAEEDGEMYFDRRSHLIRSRKPERKPATRVGRKRSAKEDAG